MVWNNTDELQKPLKSFKQYWLITKIKSKIVSAYVVRKMNAELNVHKQESSFTILQEHFARVALFDCLGEEEKYSSQYRWTINCPLFLCLSVCISTDVGFPHGLTRKCWVIVWNWKCIVKCIVSFFRKPRTEWTLWTHLALIYEMFLANKRKQF